VSGELFIVLTLHYSRIVAACLHALQALTVLPTLQALTGESTGDSRDNLPQAFRGDKCHA
jgi:hypothetical protein